MERNGVGWDGIPCRHRIASASSPRPLSLGGRRRPSTVRSRRRRRVPPAGDATPCGAREASWPGAGGQLSRGGRHATPRQRPRRPVATSIACRARLVPRTSSPFPSPSAFPHKISALVSRQSHHPPPPPLSPLASATAHPAPLPPAVPRPEKPRLPSSPPRPRHSPRGASEPDRAPPPIAARPPAATVAAPDLTRRRSLAPSQPPLLSHSRFLLIATRS